MRPDPTSFFVSHYFLARINESPIASGKITGKPQPTLGFSALQEK
jgi:hypothetical protein